MLARAAKLQYPADLVILRASEDEEAAAATRRVLTSPDSRLPDVIGIGPDGKSLRVPPAEVRRRMQKELAHAEPPLGDWPSIPPASAGLSVVNGLDGKPLEKVHLLLLLPTEKSAAAPAGARRRSA